MTIANTVILSPNYPNIYPSGLDCRLNIAFERNKQIQLEFKIFEVFTDDQDNEAVNQNADHSNGTNRCAHSDYIEVIDNNGNGTSERVFRFCGSIIPRPIVSQGHSMELRFQTNSNRSRSETGTGKHFKLVAKVGTY